MPLLNLSVELAAGFDLCRRHTNIYGGRGLLGLGDLSLSLGLVSRGGERKKPAARRETDGVRARESEKAARGLIGEERRRSEGGKQLEKSLSGLPGLERQKG